MNSSVRTIKNDLVLPPKLYELINCKFKTFKRVNLILKFHIRYLSNFQIYKISLITKSLIAKKNLPKPFNLKEFKYETYLNDTLVPMN